LIRKRKVENNVSLGMERFWKYKIDHVLFWITTIGFHMFTRMPLLQKAGTGEFFFEIAIRNALLALIIYINLFILIPKLAQTKKWVLYFIFLILDFVIYILGKNAHDVYLNGYVLGDVEKRFFFYNTFYNLSIAFFYMAFALALQLSRAWYEQREHIRKIEIEKLNTELDYLKAQINPHFLFNSINTIYFQIDKHNALARETLSAFSQMLRYQLYECTGNQINIEKEISYLKNYVELQRHRKDQNYKISFRHENTNGFQIAPLLLIPFVENAFKHVSHLAHGNEIDISLIRNNGTFVAKIVNTCDDRIEKSDSEIGIGLKNAKRRLELLYPLKYKLYIKKDIKTFEVNLELKLN
jgi:two-component system, LytTR family, sensor kinase